MIDMQLSAEDIFESVANKLEEFDNEKMKHEIQQMINNYKCSKNVDFTNKASKTNHPKWLEFFVNLIYDMLEVDNKYSRMAGCHIFRKICPVLSSDLIMNLLGFVIDFDDEDESQSNDGDSSVDEEENSDDASESVKESSDDDTADKESVEENSDDESESDNINIHNLDSLKEKMMESNKADVNLDDVPIEELEQYDRRLEKLMTVFKGKLPSDEVKRLKRREIAEKNTRFRGSHLLKIMVKEAVNPNHLIMLVVPFLRSIQSQDEDKEFKNVLCKIYQDLVAVRTFKQTEESADVLVGKEIKKLFYLPRGNIELYQSSGLRFLIKTGERSANMKTSSKNECKPIFDSVAQVLEDIFTVKNCHINQKLLNIPLSLMKEDFISICDIIRKHAFRKSRKSLKKNIALNLLKTAYQQRCILQEVSLEEFKKFQNSLSENIVKILNSIIRPNQINAKYMLDFFGLMKAIYIMHMKQNDCNIGFDWDSIRSSMKGFGTRFYKKKMSLLLAKSFSSTKNTIHQKMKSQNTGDKKKSKNQKLKSKEVELNKNSKNNNTKTKPNKLEKLHHAKKNEKHSDKYKFKKLYSKKFKKHGKFLKRK